MALRTDSRGIGNLTGTATLIGITVATAAIIAPYALGMALTVDASSSTANDIVAGDLPAAGTNTPTTATATATPAPTPSPTFDFSADVDRSVIDWGVRRSVDADTLTVEHTGGALPTATLALEVRGYTVPWSTLANGDGTATLTRADVPTTGLNLDGVTVRLLVDGQPVATATLPE